MHAPGHRNSGCTLEIMLMQKNLNGTGNFIFSECCCEGQETFSRAVLFPWLHHVYVLFLAREKLMLTKTHLSNNINNKEILFLIKTGKISDCPLRAWEELFLPLSLGIDRCFTAAAWGAGAIPAAPPPASPVGGKFSTFKPVGFVRFKQIMAWKMKEEIRTGRKLWFE